MNFIPADCFAGILSFAMDEYKVGSFQLAKILKERGIEGISFQSIADYVNGNHTPSFDRAKILLQELDYQIDDDELSYAIARNRELIKNENDYLSADRKEIKRTIRIKLKTLYPEYQAEDTERLLYGRIQELYGDETKLSQYLQGLIAKDLREYILSKEDVAQNE